MISHTDEWVHEYEWLTKRLLAIHIHPVVLSEKRNIMHIAAELRRMYRTIELDEIIKRFEHFSKITVYKKNKRQHLIRRLLNKICLVSQHLLP